MELKDRLRNIIKLLDRDEIELANKVLVEIVYSENKSKTVKLFLRLQELERKEMKEELMLHYMASESNMNNVVHVSKALLENKTSDKAKMIAAILFEDDNIPQLIQHCISYFPKGNSYGASNSGVWYFTKFKEMLVKYKEKYQEGGSSRSWAENFNYSEYIDLVLNN